VLREPDQPVNFFFLGPRVFISADDLQQLDLVKKGSRIRYACLIKVYDDSRIDAVADRLRSIADKDAERVDTFRTAQSRTKRFFDNLFLFLSLIGVFTLLLAGIGIQSALTAFLKEKENTIAILKTIGATSRFFTCHYSLILALLGLGGTLLGLVAGFGVQKGLQVLFSGILPPNVPLLFSWKGLLEGLGLGVMVVGLYSIIPLHRLKNVKPVAVLRKERIRFQKSGSFFLTAVLIFLFFLLQVFRQVETLKTGLVFVSSVMALILIAYLLTVALLFLMNRLNLKSLVMRQAVKGLFRPNNATQSIIVTLTASLTVIFSIHLIQRNLDAALIQSFPADAPNLFFLDIQPSQLDSFSKTLAIRTPYYPIVRARVLSINGEKIDRPRERQRRGDNLARTFNLTYRGHLLEDEVLVKGNRLFNDEWGHLQVSVLDTVAKIKAMDIGDRITFKIQGIPLQATISSIRSRTRESIRPFFYFVFPETALKNAPQTIFTAVRVPPQQTTAIQSKIVANFPNVSAIDVTATLSTFAGVMKKLSIIVHFFAIFSMAAGILIILSSILATRFARIQEAVYYKILGAKSGYVIKVFILENLFLGLMSALLALALSQTGSWLICTRAFKIAYVAFPFDSLLLIAAAASLVIIVGLLPSISILRSKPVLFLRNQTQE
jgi:putative ABC transport system permease protein